MRRWQMGSRSEKEHLSMERRWRKARASVRWWVHSRRRRIGRRRGTCILSGCERCVAQHHRHQQRKRNDECECLLRETTCARTKPPTRAHNLSYPPPRDTGGPPAGRPAVPRGGLLRARETLAGLLLTWEGAFGYISKVTGPVIAAYGPFGSPALERRAEPLKYPRPTVALQKPIVGSSWHCPMCRSIHWPEASARCGPMRKAPLP